MGIIEKLFGSYSEKEIKRIMPLVNKIETLEGAMKNLSDDELKNKTEEFRNRLAKGETLEDILPEAFAVVREASSRVLGMRHFKVQLIGGIILHQGRIAEMKTGEGKTLVVTLPAYLNALSGKGVHIITVNDYLATYHSAWMGKLYKFLGLTVGLVVPNMTPAQKQIAYASDITYGTNNEFGFDYLRDNMCLSKSEMVQRELNYAVVDEVDSILIDEARTPLIISGMGKEATELYIKADKLVRRMKAKVIVESDNKTFDDSDEEYDYIVDEKAKTTALTEKGTKKCEEYFGIDSLTDVENMEISHTINQALRAHGIMKKDTDYIEKDGQILIVDEFTGRIMEGRRYSEGLHQAIEAKEGVKIARESKTLATITFQNYFRLYNKLAGMTGTAKTEETEFKGIFGLDVVEIPTNKPVVRIDTNDLVYKAEMGKFKAIVAAVKECYEKGQPVLVGTVSIEKSELLSKMLKAEKIPHEVLNAKYHEREAEIVAQAGKYKAVTIATNMAGRGTDILLGGNPEFMARRALEKKGVELEKVEFAMSPLPTENPEILSLREEYKKLESEYKDKLKDEKNQVIAAGGLKIIGSERHESRRIDDQLRGRAGRQGDVGESTFFISLEDDLMRLFGTDKVQYLADMLGLPEDMPIEQRMLTGAIETAQKRVEGRNYSIRKSVLEYDDVMNKQRNIIYAQRKQILDSDSIEDVVKNMATHKIEDIVHIYTSDLAKGEKVDVEGLNATLQSFFGIELEENEIKKDALEEIIEAKVFSLYDGKKEIFKKQGIENQYNMIEKLIMLRTVDEKWQNHIDNMAHLKEGIHLRAYGQTNPVEAYKQESFDIFSDMTNEIKEAVVRGVFKVKYNTDNTEDTVSKLEQSINKVDNFSQSNFGASVQKNTTGAVKKEPIRVEKTIGRNEPCPCGSGKKYKQCCGK